MKKNKRIWYKFNIKSSSIYERYSGEADYVMNIDLYPPFLEHMNYYNKDYNYNYHINHNYKLKVKVDNLEPFDISFNTLMGVPVKIVHFMNEVIPPIFTTKLIQEIKDRKKLTKIQKVNIVLKIANTYEMEGILKTLKEFKDYIKSREDITQVNATYSLLEDILSEAEAPVSQYGNLLTICNSESNDAEEVD